MLGNLLSLLIGTMLGMLIRNSPGALVAYFVFTLLLPNVSELLATSQHWFHDLRPWVDFSFVQTSLFEGTMTGTQWAHLAATVAVWLVLPGVVGVRKVMHAEVK